MKTRSERYRSRRKPSRNPYIRDRHRARRKAFFALYSLSFMPQTDEESLRAVFNQAPGQQPDYESQQGAGDDFAFTLFSGVCANVPRLDQAINSFSLKWRADRLGKIELIILRMALFELFSNDTPAKVVKREALGLAIRFGADAAINMIDGILDAAAKANAAASDAEQWKIFQVGDK